MNLLKKIKIRNSEELVGRIHRYGLTLFWWWFLIFVLFTLPFFFMFWLFSKGFWGEFVLFLSLFLGFVLFFRVLFFWKKNVFIVTTNRVVDIERRGLFEEIITEVYYDKIEDISAKTKGFFGIIFGYGELRIQTSGGGVEIFLNKIKKPVHIQQKINKLRELYMRSKRINSGPKTVKGIISILEKMDDHDLLEVKKYISKRIV